MLYTESTLTHPTGLDRGVYLQRTFAYHGWEGGLKICAPTKIEVQTVFELLPTHPPLEHFV